MSVRKLPLAVSLALLAAACGPGGSGEAPVLSGEVVVKASEWEFQPASFRVEAGKPVKLALQNAGRVEHNMVVTAGGNPVQLDVLPGRSATVEFVPQQPGVYEIACTIPGHREAGMVGKVEVVQPKGGS